MLFGAAPPSFSPQHLNYHTPDIIEAVERSEIFRGHAAAENQQGRVLTRMVGRGRGRVAAVVGGYHKNVAVPHFLHKSA